MINAVAKVKEMIGWDEKYPICKDRPHTVRSVGMAMAMQGSGIGGVDVGSVQHKLNDDGFYTLMIGCSDMGTGCDTILAQMAADGLGCEFEDIIVRGGGHRSVSVLTVVPMLQVQLTLLVWRL